MSPRRFRGLVGCSRGGTKCPRRHGGTSQNPWSGGFLMHPNSPYSGGLPIIPGYDRSFPSPGAPCTSVLWSLSREDLPEDVKGKRLTYLTYSYFKLNWLIRYGDPGTDVRDGTVGALYRPACDGSEPMINDLRGMLPKRVLMRPGMPSGSSSGDLLCTRCKKRWLF